MTQGTREGMVAIRFKDVDHDAAVDEALENRCHALAGEFPETTHFEIALGVDAGQVSAHAHVSGKNTQFAAHASAPDARRAAESALDKLERELRRHHDKTIFSARRAVQKQRANR